MNKAASTGMFMPIGILQAAINPGSEIPMAKGRAEPIGTPINAL
jgi:hypothetical protein